MRLNGIREFVADGEHGTRIVGRSPLTKRGRVSLLTYRAQRRLNAAFWRRSNATLLCIVEEVAAARGLDDGAVQQTAADTPYVTPKTESVVPLSCQYGR